MSSDDWNGSCSNLELLSRNLTSDVWNLSRTSEGGSSADIIAILLLHIVALIWNSLVGILIIKNRLYKKPSYMILLHLVAVDILWCSASILVEVISTGFGEYVFGASDYERCYFCKAYNSLIFSITLVSVFSLVFMSLDRLIYTKWPLRYFKIVTLRNTLILLVLFWLISLLFCFPLIIDFGKVRIFECLSCKLDISGSVPYLAVMSTLSTTMAFFMVVMNVWIITIV